MTFDPARSARNWFEGIQHAAGLNLVDFARWLGVVVAATWLWTEQVPAMGRRENPDSPVVWLGGILNSVGVDNRWATTVDEWLSGRSWLFVVLTVAAALVLNGAFDSLNIVWLLLLAAVSIHGFMEVAGTYLGVSLLLCLLAILVDKLQIRMTANSPYVSQPGHSLRIWLLGPVANLLLAVFAPFALLVLGVSAYRVRPIAPHLPDLVTDLRRVSDASLAEANAEDVLAVLARAILLSADEEKRADVLWGLERRHQGARTVRRTVD